MKKLLFTHSDMDGAGCYIIFSVANQDNVKGKDYDIIVCENGNVDDLVEKHALNNDDVSRETQICFSDICASREVLERLAMKFNSVVVWDHHVTNQYALQVFPNSIVATTNKVGRLESGTSIMYEVFTQSAMVIPDHPSAQKFLKGSTKLFDRLVDNIRSYDTYEWKTTNNLEAKQLQTLFGLLGYERFVNKYIDRIINDSDDDTLISANEMDFVEAKLEWEQKAIDAIGRDDVYIVTVKGQKAAVRFSGGVSISELAHQFLSKHPDIDLFIGLNLGLGIYGFRSLKEDADLGVVFAQPIGGGGHAKAAGAPIHPELRDDIVGKLLEYLDPEFKDIEDKKEEV